MEGRFLSRWSRLKAGKIVESEKKDESSEQAKDLEPLTDTQPPAQPEADKLPSLDDVERMDQLAPDFSAFMQPGVDPAVQQAALKKMFSDPHFNIMDGLDEYIDDYSKPNPIPTAMLKRMVQSDMLSIFGKGEEQAFAAVANNFSSHEQLQDQVIHSAALPNSSESPITSMPVSSENIQLNPASVPANKKSS